ncbi:hypothetical protein [Methylosinus sp. Ce-a6]|uniref:hypothetical protein n=1 Tax=Methylosinus sp. Ce-a6 TaxID=2172005 RepID=UPI00135C924C|nr:hypothetical protein [Methylosinus sp. Ce-a6]
MTTTPTTNEMKAQIERGAEIERRASTGWFALLYKTCAEASKARGFSLYDAYDAPDWKATIESTFPNGCGQLFHKTADGGITGLPGFVEASADDIRFMEFARAFVPIAIRFIEAHLPEIEQLEAHGKRAFGADLTDPGNRLSLFSWDQGTRASLLIHAFRTAEIRRLENKAHLMRAGCFDERERVSDESWRRRNEELFRDAEQGAALAQEAQEALDHG